MRFASPDAARRRRLAVALGVAAVVLACDQVTKSVAVAHLASGPVHVLGPLSLALTYNSGVAFSLGSGLTLPIVLVGVGLVVLAAWFVRGAPSTGVAIGLGLVIGGAAGNLADRLFRARDGAVVDFIRFSFWPTFNVADAAIVSGCVLLALAFLRAEAATARRHGP